MRARRLIVVFVIAAVASLSIISPSLAAHGNFTPISQAASIQMLPGTTQPISVALGNQTDPHVACNVVTYTEDNFKGKSLVHYFDFATNLDLSLLGTDIDRQSETDGQKIAYTVLGPSGDQIIIYDLTEQTATPIPAVNVADPAIGGNLVAFVQGNSSTALEIGVYEQSTRTTTQLTNDGLLNRSPAVSPDGKVVVWEKCKNDGTGCDIYSATQTGPGAYTTRLVTGSGEDKSPDSNGQIIAYISDKNGENDIYFQRLDSSNEMHLALPDDQRDVRISGNLIVFESKSGDSYDVFLYDLSTARLYQVTNTPDNGEGLSDIVEGCNGLNRIVYTAPGPFGDYDVYAFNFQLNDSLNDQLNDLNAQVQSFNLPDGPKTSLLSKLADALEAVSNSDKATACDALTAFINASQAQSGKKLTADQAKQLVDAAVQIKSDLGCQ